MDKDDILAKSRKENKDRDLYNEEINISSSSAGSFVALVLTTFFFVLQSVIKNEFKFELYAILFSFGATNFIMRAIRLKRKRDIVFAIIYTAATVVLTGVFIYQLIASAAV